MNIIDFVLNAIRAVAISTIAASIYRTTIFSKPCQENKQEYQKYCKELCQLGLYSQDLFRNFTDNIDGSDGFRNFSAHRPCSFSDGRSGHVFLRTIERCLTEIAGGKNAPDACWMLAVHRDMTEKELLEMFNDKLEFIDTGNLDSRPSEFRNTKTSVIKKLSTR
jgi:hypothetical protein